MSLIYDALKQQAGVADARRPPRRASWWRRVSPQGQGLLLLGMGAALAAPLYLLAGARTVRAPDATGSALQAHASTAPGSTTLATVDASTAIAFEAASAPPLEAGPAPAARAADARTMASADPHTDMTAAPLPAAPVMATASAVEPTATPASGAAPGPSVREPVSAAAIARAPAPATPMRITVEQRLAPGAEPVPVHDDAAIHQGIAAVEAAVAAGDDEGADDGLATLEGLLPAGSLTLLRMRAWVAHGRGGMVEAEQLYRQIIGRVPDDENAGVNIALLDARRGDVADARQRLMRLSGRTARSPLVDRALAELDGLPR